MAKDKQPAPRRIRRLLRLAVLAVVVTAVVVPAGLGFFTTVLLINDSCGESSLTPADYGHRYEAITFEARAGGTVRGYFVYGAGVAEGGPYATIIRPPAGSSGRGSRLDEVDVLARHGYAVLTFESRPCAGMGAFTLGYKEVDEVADALDYVLSRDDVDPDRIGVLGFSSAGATSVMAAARLPQIRAVVAEGGYGDFAEGAVGMNTGDLLRPLEFIYKQSIGISYRLLVGLDIDKLSPLDVIDQIAPRPILLIYGTAESSLKGGRDQLAAAGDNAELWIVPGAGHGQYLKVAPEEYERRVIAFFDRVLSD
ncbi:MAG: prolyl oligopeptidase family serine peptidase [Anaerolineae bacterium]|nr:prolyl oligopeptidase family serine peptidase [Anaerolineae bacterium]